MRTFRELIVSWPGRAAGFAKDVGVGYGAARKMVARNYVVPEHWHSILKAARARQIPLTAEELVRMSKARRRGIGRASADAAA